MNVLVTGSRGQLGTELRRLSPLHTAHQYVWADIDELDLTNAAAVADFVHRHHIDTIVNCAAFTNVDGAEQHEADALRVNADAVANLARTGRRIIHISTDYVFSGEDCLPYRESDQPNPHTAYGRTKLEGEKQLLAICPDAIILRTAWLYSPWGKNFVKTMLSASEQHSELRVVYDQIGSPTYAGDLAEAVFAVLDCPTWHAGIYHFTDEGVCSWFDFTIEILRQANLILGTNRYQAAVLPIRSEEYTYRTQRPHYSVLDKQKFKSTFHFSIPYWTDSLRQCLTAILQAQ